MSASSRVAPVRPERDRRAERNGGLEGMFQASFSTLRQLIRSPDGNAEQLGASVKGVPTENLS